MPYWTLVQPVTAAPAEYNAAKASSDPAVKNSVFRYDPWPYEGINGSLYWHGLESHAQLAKGAPSWNNGRFKQFEDKHYGLRLDDVGGNPLRGVYGFLCSTPFDQHFLLALIAPAPLLSTTDSGRCETTRKAVS